jgi:hypothetical protein
MGRNAQALSGQCQAGAEPFKKGGAVKAKKHDDVKEDKAMIKKMVKPAALKACGGKVKK